MKFLLINLPKKKHLKFNFLNFQKFTYEYFGKIG